MVDVPNGGGPVDDGVPTELPEGTVVINAAAIRLHGTETIDNLINTAVDELLSEGVQISMQDPNPNDNVPVAISNGEYVIPPEVAEKIGYKKLEDMNERGRAYLQKQTEQEKQQQQPQQPTQQPPESFMGESMPPEQAGPPPAPVQSEEQAMAMMGMADGGRVPLEGGGGLARAKDAFINWFSSTYLGGTMDPAESAVDKMLMVPPAPFDKARKADVLPPPTNTTESNTQYYDSLRQRNAKGGKTKMPKSNFINRFKGILSGDSEPEPKSNKGAYKELVGNMRQGENESDEEFAQRVQAQIDTASTLLTQGLEGNKSRTKSIISAIEKPKPNRGAFFEAGVDPLYDATLAELGPVTQFTSNVQRAAEGGFIGDYNYAQPQQATMGTPFPNAVDSNPQQSQSFLRPNDAKKKSRVGLEKGDEVPTPPLPREKPPNSAKVNFWTRIIAGEIAQNPDEWSLVLDVLKNRENSKFRYLRETVDERESVDKSAFSTFRHHAIDSTGKLVNITEEARGDIVASANDMQAIKNFVESNINTLSSNTEITHFKGLEAKWDKSTDSKRLLKVPTSTLQQEKIKNLPPEHANKPLLHDYYTEVAERPKSTPFFLSPIPREKPSPPAKEADSAKEEDSEAGFKLRHDTDFKVSDRFKLFPPQKLQDFPTEQYQNLENELFDYAEELRKRSDGLQLSDAYPVDSPETEFIEKSFNDHIDRMAEQVIKGQGYINFERLLKDESGDTRSREKLEQYRESLKDDLHRMYQKPVYDIINSGLTEKEVSDGNELTYEESLQSVPGRQNIDNYYKLESDARRRLAKKPVDPVVSNPNEDKRQQPRATPNLNVFRKTPTFLDT